jgi:hypothetical protein
VSKQVLTISGWSNKERSLTGQFVGFGELSLIKSGGKSLGCRKWCVALWWLHVIVQSSLIEDWSQSWRHLTGCRLNAFVVPAYRFWAVWTKFTQQPRLLIGRSLRRSASWISQLTSAHTLLVHSRTIGFPACPIGLVPAKCFVSSAVGVYGRRV